METTWQNNWQPSREYSPLKEHIKADVVIIGGGITGITLAYLLSKVGKNVVVLEKGTLKKSSYTAYTTAMVNAQIDTDYQDLENLFGKDKAKTIWEYGMDAIQSIEEAIKRENINCEFVRVAEYYYANEEGERKDVAEEGMLAKNAGFPIELNTDDLKVGNVGNFKFGRQAKFHPLKYCDGLRAAALRHGARFFENSEVTEIKNGSPATVVTKEGSVEANWVVTATYEPFNKPKELFAKKGMYVTYMCEFSIPKGVLEEALYVDGANPYHYFRVDSEVYVDKNKDRLVIGGADHRKEIKMDPEKNFAEIVEYAKKILKGAEHKLERKWSGGILETIDGLPFIGRYSKEYGNLLVATGFSGNGMTYSMIAGKILTDIILGRMESENIFDPLRKFSPKTLLVKGRDYVGIFFHGAVKNFFRKT